MGKPLTEEQRRAKVEYAREWRKKNPNYTKEYYQRPDVRERERQRERTPEYREKRRNYKKNNPEKGRAAHRRWYAKATVQNPDMIRAARKRADSKEERKAYRRRLSTVFKHEKRHREGWWKRQGINITLEEFNAMAERCHHVCEICGEGNFVSGKFRILCVDHSHGGDGPSAVRGLLCASCNQSLGKFKDSPELLIRAAVYLIKRGKPVLKTPAAC